MRYTPGSDCFGKTDSNRFGPSQGTLTLRRIIWRNSWRSVWQVLQRRVPKGKIDRRGISEDERPINAAADNINETEKPMKLSASPSWIKSPPPVGRHDDVLNVASSTF